MKNKSIFILSIVLLLALASCGRASDNETAKDFAARSPLSLNMSDLNGNEKFYNLPEPLPTDSERVGSINTGDLMLYGSDCLVLFYESFSTIYSYTRLGTIEDTTGLAAALGSGSVEVSFAAASHTGFSDVRADAWYAEAVRYCVENGFMSGTAADIFSPDAFMSRAMLVTVLYRVAGSPQITGTSGFPDVVQGAWYADAVTWGVQNEIVSGYGSGLFGTNEPVTHEQVFTFLWRYSGSAEVGETDNRFPPEENATRAGVATILHNYLCLEQSVAESMPALEASMTSINITVGNAIFPAKLYSNNTTRAFLQQLPMILNMSELNGNEKFYYLPNRLPADSEQIGNIKNGDLMLFGSDCLVLFYKSFSTSYSYTRLGYIDDPSGLAAALGTGSVEVSFTISN